MKDLAALVAAYTTIDRGFESELASSSAAGNLVAIERIQERQRINDQAYFVICWGQLEVEIDEACRAAIRRHQSRSEWVDRRCWDLYNPDDKRLSGLGFDDRAAIVLDKRGGPGSPWARVQGYYSLRNQIAHGKVRQGRIDVAAVADDFYAIQGALTR